MTDTLIANDPAKAGLPLAFRQYGLVFLVGTVLCCLMGCQTSSSPVFSELAPSAMPPGPGTANYSTNILHEGDTVSITFQYSTNFNTFQKITLDGLLNLEAVGPIRAAGRTALELQLELGKAYKPLVKDDVVTVKLISAVDGVYVSGAVFRPGRIPLERPLTIVEAIMEAGGFDANRASLSNVIVLRIDHGKQKSYHVNLKRVLKGKEEAPFYLRPFDVVHVPTRTFNF